jgi:hypothetical protein
MSEGATKTTIADKARDIVYGDREKTYGHPSKNLKVVADLWSAYLSTQVNAQDVCNLMILFKVARLRNDPEHEDSKVDIIGYTLLMERLKENEKKL